MSRLFSSHKRFIGLGLMGALVVALAILGTLGGFSQRASAQVTPLTLVHVEPSGIDYTGNPYCPDTVWTGTKKPVVNPWHDCNNITSQNHVIRTAGWDTMSTVISWNVENFSGAVATIQAQGTCGSIAEVTSRAGWDTNNNSEHCLVIHSSTPGETRITLTWREYISSNIYTTSAVVKEWDSLVDSVILKYGDLEKVKVYYDVNGDTVIGTSEYKELYLPKDVNGDGKRTTADEHILDRQGTWQDHGVVWDEALKRIKVPVPLEITEVVHGEHQVLINSVSVTTHQPTEGALILAEIESERNCTFFTDPVGSSNYGSTISGVSDNLGRLTVYLDTVCEEQAVIHFYAQYPNLPGSLRQGLHEWIGINWTTIELAKQPQIRWAGEEIVLEKRWALPDEWFPNVNTDGTLKDICPHVYNIARYNRLITSSAGDLVGGIPEMFEPYTEPDRLMTIVDVECISRALAASEDQGEGDFEVTIHEWLYEGTGIQASADGERARLQAYLDQLNAEIEAGTMTTGAAKAAIYNDYYETEFLGEMFLDPDQFNFSEVLNKHAFLVWWLKIYETKLTNVDGERADHNAGAWSFGDGEDTEADTLNVSQDALLRVKVKGWFEGGNNSSRGAVCVDLDGDGNGLEGEDASEPGVPYPLTQYEAGCPDPNDEILDHGHWVLPDDLATLAGPDAINTRPNWDVMSEPDDAKTTAVGPKSTLDSHDAVLRPWLINKTVVPDGAITEADAIMPPLKIRAEIADDDAGFLKEALKGVIYANSNDYHSILIPASPWIPAIVNDGGYDWMSFGLPSCPDADSDGVCDAVDLCPADFDPTNGDLDSDGTGDVCDDDADGDGILDDGDASGIKGDNTCINGDLTLCDDNCRFKANSNQADVDADGVGTVCDVDDNAAGVTDRDSDGDTIIDGVDNCPTKSNATQADTDGDGYGDACDANAGVPYNVAPPVPYPFWTIINKFGAPYPYYIEFYTDNRGEGMFFANGDFNLSFADCRTDPVSGAPDCSDKRPDVVGESNITVIGDYPYYRKHTSVQSNPVVKTWEWAGYKRVTSQRIDATHTAIVASLVDRDGYCKYSVGSDPTAANSVQFSPSLHEVQHEWIEFLLNTEVGYIRDISPNALLVGDDPTLDPHVHTPLMKTRATGLEDGVIVNNRKAMARAEDGRILDYYDEARCLEEGDCQLLVAEEACQAWIVIEHPIDEIPNVSVVFHDPEGDINRHWPPNDLEVNLVQGWNDSCFVDEEATVEEAMADFIDDVLAVYRYNNADKDWDRYFPGRCDEEGLCTLESIESYDQLFILIDPAATWTTWTWVQEISAPPASVHLVGASAEDEVPAAWNSVCYAGSAKSAEEATSDISSAFQIMYTLGTDQAWRRYIPDRPLIPDTLTTLHQFDSVILLVTAEGGVTWVFDP